MAYFEHTDKSTEYLPDLHKEKKLNKLFGTEFLLKKIRVLGPSDIGNFRMGALALTAIFASMSYYFYRQNYKQKMMSSSAFYKLMLLEPLNAGNQFLWNAKTSESTNLFSYYYRMPRKEFDIKYRMRSAYITGEFDHDKEVLIPRKKDGVDGYDVISPFYYYYKEYPSFYLHMLQDGKPFGGTDVERAAMPVFRGWIPYHMKDRRLRPHDSNKGKETIYGTIKLSQVKTHDFVIPNDPTSGFWNNYSLEDIAKYWDIPNVYEAKYCYFQEIDFKQLDAGKADIYPLRPSVQEAIIEDGFDKNFNLGRNYKQLGYSTSTLFAFFGYLLYLAA